MSIFHSEAFAKLHGIELFQYGGCVLPVKNGRSPGVGTFGGFSMGASTDAMERVIADAKPSVVTLAPVSHDQAHFARSFNVLERAGYSVAWADLNHDLVIDERALPERMDSGNRKKWVKFKREGFYACSLPRFDWREAWDLLSNNRQRSDRKLSMQFETIEAQERAVPGSTFVFGAYQRTGLSAAAICYALSREVFYVYAWGDACKSEFAPTVALAAFIYLDAGARGFKILDAGISTLNGEPNPGLIRFKESLGFKPSLKVTMCLNT